MARRSNAEKEAEDEAIKNWNPRYKHKMMQPCLTTRL